MTAPTLAPPPPEARPSQAGPAPARRSRPVLSPPHAAPRTGRGAFGLSLVVHLLLVAAFVLFYRVGSHLPRRAAA